MMYLAAIVPPADFGKIRATMVVFAAVRPPDLRIGTFQAYFWSPFSFSLELD